MFGHKSHGKLTLFTKPVLYLPKLRVLKIQSSAKHWQFLVCPKFEKTANVWTANVSPTTVYPITGPRKGMS